MTTKNAIDYFKAFLKESDNDDFPLPTTEPYEIAIRCMEECVRRAEAETRRMTRQEIEKIKEAERQLKRCLVSACTEDCKYYFDDCCHCDKLMTELQFYFEYSHKCMETVQKIPEVVEELNKEFDKWKESGTESSEQYELGICYGIGLSIKILIKKLDWKDLIRGLITKLEKEFESEKRKMDKIIDGDYVLSFNKKDEIDANIKFIQDSMGVLYDLLGREKEVDE